MNINKNILSIPPYISTGWQNIASLNVVDGNILIVTLINSSQIKVPALSPQQMQKVFETHAQVIEGNSKKEKDVELSFGIPPGISGNITGMMEHDPAQSSAADLPKEMLEKVTSLTQAMGIGEMIDQMPSPQPHCNCPFCQVSRHLHGKEPLEAESEEEPILDNELSFRDWTIEEVGEKLYKVTSPFDENESYRVFLGTPVGCTCGASNCEHIKIVLNS